MLRSGSARLPFSHAQYARSIRFLRPRKNSAESPTPAARSCATLWRASGRRMQPGKNSGFPSRGRQVRSRLRRARVPACVGMGRAEGTTGFFGRVGVWITARFAQRSPFHPHPAPLYTGWFFLLRRLPGKRRREIMKKTRRVKKESNRALFTSKHYL